MLSKTAHQYLFLGKEASIHLYELNHPEAKGET